MSNFIELHMGGVPRLFNLDLIELVCIDPDDGRTLVFPFDVFDGSREGRFYVVDESYEDVRRKILEGRP